MGGTPMPPSLASEGFEAFSAHDGYVGVLVFLEAQPVLLLGLVDLLVQFEGAAGIVESGGGPFGVGVEDVDLEKFFDRVVILFLGKISFADLELGAGGGGAVVGGGDLGVRVAGF